MIDFFQWSDSTAMQNTSAWLHDSEPTIRYFCVRTHTHTHTHSTVYKHCNACRRALFGQVRCMTHSLHHSGIWTSDHQLQTANLPLHHQDPVLQCISRIFEGNIVGHRSLICQSCHVLKCDWWWMNEELGDYYQKFSFLLMGCLCLCLWASFIKRTYAQIWS